tara:strand:+ start:595 stop:1605 length:1011 start_codon:yes stop_codon:yes gene_type:complete
MFLQNNTINLYKQNDIMATVHIIKSVFFEKTVPTSIHEKKNSIEATQKRLALQDALNLNDLSRAKTAVVAYRPLLSSLISSLEQNRRCHLTEQPMFDWGWGSGEYMSSCWRWEKLMVHASGYDISMAKAMDTAIKTDFKGASKEFHTAGEYVITIVEKILPEWTWKENAALHVTFPKFWNSKLNFIYAMKDLCTLQYAWSGAKGITDKNALKLLKRIEYLSTKSLSVWSNEDNTALMNWARASRALVMARKFKEADDYGKAIYLVKSWEPVLEKLVNNSHLNTIMEELVTQLRNITSDLDDWITSNNSVHFKVEETVELEPIDEENLEIKYTIKSL